MFVSLNNYVQENIINPYNTFFEEANIILEPFNKFFKSLFLLIISIFKILSGNYIPLLLICFTLFYLFRFLSQRKLVLSCNNCENGSWWYKCKKNTGFGSYTCKNYNNITNLGYDFVNMILNAPSKYLGILLLLYEHVINTLKKSSEYIIETSKLIYLFPPMLLYKYIIKPVSNALFEGFKKIYNLLSNFSCAFTLPVLGVKLDLCKLIIDGIKALIKIIELVFETLIDLIVNIMNIIIKFIYNHIFMNLIKLIITSINFIVNNIFSVFLKASELMSVLMKPLNVIFKIPISHYFILLIDFIIDIIVEYVPYGYIIKRIPSILLACVVVTLIILYVIPTLGGLYSLFILIKSIIYALLGLDDNSDFMFMLEFIYKYIINLYNNVTSSAKE